MRKCILGSITLLFAGAGLVLAQSDGPINLPREVVKPAAPDRHASMDQPADPPPPPHPAIDGDPAEVIDDVGPGPGGGFWASADYLLWWIKDGNAPPLVTSGSATDRISGAIGQPGTTVLFGGEIEHEEFSGGRFDVGYWCHDCHDVGIEGRFFFLAERTNNFTASCPPNSVIALPFFNLNSGQEFSEIACFPGLANATVTASTSSRLLGAEANLLAQLCCGEPMYCPCSILCDAITGGPTRCCLCNYSTHLIGGFRYLDLEEDLNVGENINVNTDLSQFPQDAQFAGDHITTADQFQTRNHFYGGQVGIDTVLNRGPLWLDFRGTVALGDTQEIININGGQQIVNPAGATTNFKGGLFALPTNIGRFSRDRFAVVDELGVNAGYQITPHVGVEVGYTFLYWSKVVRPGDQIDRELDITKIPNFNLPATPVSGSRPGVPFKETDFWAQGINVGLTFHW